MDRVIREYNERKFTSQQSFKGKNKNWYCKLTKETAIAETAAADTVREYDESNQKEK